MKKEKKIKYNENSRLRYRKKVFLGNDYETGEPIYKEGWFEANGELSLGSLAKPSEVLEIKYNIPKTKK